MISALAEHSGAFDFLKEEPETCSDADILPGRKNSRLRKFLNRPMISRP